MPYEVCIPFLGRGMGMNITAQVRGSARCGILPQLPRGEAPEKM